MGWRSGEEGRRHDDDIKSPLRGTDKSRRGHDVSCPYKIKRRGVRLFENSFNGLHGSDGVKLIPAVIRVVDIGTPDEIPLSNHGFKVRTVVLAAGFRRVGLPYSPLAYRFED